MRNQTGPARHIALIVYSQITVVGGNTQRTVVNTMTYSTINLICLSDLEGTWSKETINTDTAGTHIFLISRSLPPCHALPHTFPTM